MENGEKKHVLARAAQRSSHTRTALQRTQPANCACACWLDNSGNQFDPRRSDVVWYCARATSGTALRRAAL